MRKIAILILTLALFNCSSGNLEWVKDRAEARWKRQGFEVVDRGRKSSARKKAVKKKTARSKR